MDNIRKYGGSGIAKTVHTIHGPGLWSGFMSCLDSTILPSRFSLEVLKGSRGCLGFGFCLD